MVITLVLLFNLMGINTFQTENCEHGELTEVISKLGKCLEKDSEVGDNYDHCTIFEDGRECVTENLKDCFLEEDLETIVKNTLATIRNASAQLLLHQGLQQAQGFFLSEEDIDSLFSTCPNIPDKSTAQNVTSQKFKMLEAGVRTDKNCTKDETMTVNAGTEQCLKTETANFNAQLGRSLTHLGSFQSAICSLLDKTVGKCIRKPLPLCFSQREKLYLKSEIAETIEDLVGLTGISFSSCSAFSSSEIINAPSGLLHILFMIFYFYVFN